MVIVVKRLFLACTLNQHIHQADNRIRQIVWYRWPFTVHHQPFRVEETTRACALIGNNSCVRIDSKLCVFLNNLVWLDRLLSDYLKLCFDQQQMVWTGCVVVASQELSRTNLESWLEFGYSVAPEKSQFALQIALSQSPRDPLTTTQQQQPNNNNNNNPTTTTATTQRQQ